MARPREFDRDEALNSALEAFWAKGYEATSMADLMDAMNLQKGSIYAAFGDKKKLFIESLQKYTETMYSHYVTVFKDASNAYAGLQQLLTKDVVEMTTDCKHRKGCFTNNTMVEMGPHCADIRGVLMDAATRAEKLFAKQIKQAQDDGDIRTDIPAEDLAIEMMVMLSGITSDSKTGLCPSRTEKATNIFLKMLKA